MIGVDAVTVVVFSLPLKAFWKILKEGDTRALVSGKHGTTNHFYRPGAIRLRRCRFTEVLSIIFM